MPVFGQSGKKLRKFFMKIENCALSYCFLSFIFVFGGLCGCGASVGTEKVSLVGQTCGFGADWPMFQRDPLKHGQASVALRRPGVLWSVYLGVQAWTNNPVVVGERVIVGSSGVWNEADPQDGVYAIELRTGAIVWRFPTPADVNGVAYVNCVVVAGTDDGRVLGLSLSNGEKVWEYASGAPKVYAQPLVLGSLVLGADSAGHVFALDGSSGVLRWRSQVAGAVRGGLASDGERVFVATETGEVAAFDLAGRQLWRRQLAFGVYSVPTVVDGLVVLGLVRETTYARPALVALDAATGDTIWEASNPRGLTGGWANLRGSVANSEGRLFWAEPYSDRVVAASVRTGEVVWSERSGRCFFKQWASPIVTGSQVVVPRHDGALRGHDLETGALLWTLRLGRHDRVEGGVFAENPEDMTTPIFADSPRDCLHSPEDGFPILATPAMSSGGILVVGTEEGYLYAVGDEERR